jgi:hypothetical protein
MTTLIPKFEQTGSTTINRPFNLKLQETISVKDFGATGDGFTDDTAAIQAAINQAYGTKAAVYIPAGTYLVTSTINITNPCAIYGDGAGSIITQSSNLTVFNIQTYAGNSIFEKFVITSPTQASAGTCISVNASSCTFRNIQIFNAYNCFVLTGVQDTVIDSCILWQFFYNGILLNGNNNDNFINKCFINGQTGSPFPSDVSTYTTGINMVDKSDATFVTDCEIILCNVGIGSSSPSGTNFPGFSTISGSYFDSCKRPAYFSNLRLTKFVNCWFGASRADQGCFLTQNCLALTFTNCSFQGNIQDGLYIDSTCQNITVSNCVAINNGIGTTIYSGIYVAANTNNFSVIGCTLGCSSIPPSGGGSVPQKYGITVGSGTSNNYIITNNLVAGNITAGVSDGGTGSSKNVSNNFG